MSCQPERVTAYVDGQLDPTARADIDAHLAGCDACTRQVSEERWLKETLRGAPRIELPEGIEARVRGTVRRARPRPWRVLLPLAASLVLGMLWIRGNPMLVSSELAWDHGHCFGKKVLPAQVWGQDGDQVRAWFTARGAAMPLLPESVNGLDLAGGRFCPLLDRKVAHVYYGNAERKLSLYQVPGPLRFDPGPQAHAGGHRVELLRVGGASIALVADEQEDVSAFRKAFQTTLAGVPEGPATMALSLTLRDRPAILFFFVHPVGL
jgi:anti-sigma factor RsiW